MIIKETTTPIKIKNPEHSITISTDTRSVIVATINNHIVINDAETGCTLYSSFKTNTSNDWSFTSKKHINAVLDQQDGD